VHATDPPDRSEAKGAGGSRCRTQEELVPMFSYTEPLTVNGVAHDMAAAEAPALQAAPASG
jgi:hypothetical protein